MNDQTAELREMGWVRIKAAHLEESTLEIAHRLGSIAEISGVARVQELVPRAVGQASISSYGGMYGLGPFPLHTDMAHWCIPPRYFLLRCVRPAPEVTTLALSFRTLFSDEEDVVVRRALFRPRRRIDGRLTGLRLHDGGVCRWDPAFIVPITKCAADLKERIRRRIDAATATKLSLENPTECIVFDNWNVLHGRTEVPPGCTHRKLERVYLDSVDL